MDGTKPTPEKPAAPGFGIARDLRQLQTHGAAGVAELREFLAQTRGRRPQEVLGLVAGSHLMRSVAVATVGAVVLLAVGTVGPWWWNRLTAAPADNRREHLQGSGMGETPAPQHLDNLIR